MTPLTKEQIQRAKEWDLLSYLQTFEPGELKRCGPHEYCTRTHDSLKISNGKWCWNSRGIGGRTARSPGRPRPSGFLRPAGAPPPWCPICKTGA